MLFGTSMSFLFNGWVGHPYTLTEKVGNTWRISFAKSKRQITVRIEIQMEGSRGIFFKNLVLVVTWHCEFKVNNVVRASLVQSRHQLPAMGLDRPWLEYREDIPGCAASELPRPFPGSIPSAIVVRVGPDD